MASLTLTHARPGSPVQFYSLDLAIQPPLRKPVTAIPIFVLRSQHPAINRLKHGQAPTMSQLAPAFDPYSAKAVAEVLQRQVIFRSTTTRILPSGELVSVSGWSKPACSPHRCAGCGSGRMRAICRRDGQPWRAPRLAESSQHSKLSPPPSAPSTLTAPANFGVVASDAIYRSSYPQPEHYDFLTSAGGLGVRTVLTLVEDLPDEYVAHLAANNVRHVVLPLRANKPADDEAMSAVDVSRALGVLADPANYPLLVHCNRGKHRTGCVVACYRKVMRGEDVGEALDEYAHYAGAKQREADRDFVRAFEGESVVGKRAEEVGPVPEEGPREEEDEESGGVALDEDACSLTDTSVAAVWAAELCERPCRHRRLVSTMRHRA